MVEFLVKHKLINTSQHGFLKARLCLTNLLCFFEEITKWVKAHGIRNVIGNELDRKVAYTQKTESNSRW